MLMVQIVETDYKNKIKLSINKFLQLLWTVLTGNFETYCL